MCITLIVGLAILIIVIIIIVVTTKKWDKGEIYGRIGDNNWFILLSLFLLIYLRNYFIEEEYFDRIYD